LELGIGYGSSNLQEARFRHEARPDGSIPNYRSLLQFDHQFPVLVTNNLCRSQFGMVRALLSHMILAPRFLPRLTATVGLFTRYGLRDFAKQQGLIDLAPEEAGDAANGNGNGTADRAVAFRKRLIELGPAYVKLGQVLSTRPDLIPEPYIAQLQRLQDDVGPVLFADIEQIIQEELGGRISKLFSEFDHEPLATASLGQAHAAALRDGRQVVVKVQRPDIRASLADDIEFFRELAKFLSAHTRAGLRVDMVGVVQQLERSLADELDYKIGRASCSERV